MESDEFFSPNCMVFVCRTVIYAVSIVKFISSLVKSILGEKSALLSGNRVDFLKKTEKRGAGHKRLPQKLHYRAFASPIYCELTSTMLG